MKKDKNFLDFVPQAVACIRVVEVDGALNYLEVHHNQWTDKLAQKLFKKPKMTKVELEQFGSFIWPHIDGENSIYDIACLVKQEFGEEAEPLYDRLTTYFRILKDKGYVTWVK